MAEVNAWAQVVQDGEVVPAVEGLGILDGPEPVNHLDYLDDLDARDDLDLLDP